MTLDFEIEPLAQALAKRAMEIIAEQKFVPAPDPLLTAKEAGKELGLGETTIRQLVEARALKRAPGLGEIRIRLSVVRAYGTEPKGKQ